MEEFKKLADLISVLVEYKDKSLNTVCSKKYGLREHTSYISMMLKRTIMDVEDLVYQLQDGRSKEEWDDVAFAGFQQIRHKLLDRAGEIERIPDSIHIEHGESGDTVLVDDEVSKKEREPYSIESFVAKIFGQ